MFNLLRPIFILFSILIWVSPLAQSSDPPNAFRTPSGKAITAEMLEAILPQEYGIEVHIEDPYMVIDKNSPVNELVRKGVLDRVGNRYFTGYKGGKTSFILPDPALETAQTNLALKLVPWSVTLQWDGTLKPITKFSMKASYMNLPRVQEAYKQMVHGFGNNQELREQLIQNPNSSLGKVLVDMGTNGRRALSTQAVENKFKRNQFEIAAEKSKTRKYLATGVGATVLVGGLSYAYYRYSSNKKNKSSQAAR